MRGVERGAGWGRGDGKREVCGRGRRREFDFSGRCREGKARRGCLSLSGESEGLVVEEFLGFEEAVEFDFGVFGGVGGVADVAHFGVAVFEAVVAADGAGIGLCGVGGTEEIANAFDGIVPGESEGDHGGFLHEFHHFGEEGEVGDMGVVFMEEGVTHFEHFDAANFETLIFESFDDFAAEFF